MQEADETPNYDLNFKPEEQLADRLVVVSYKIWLAIAYLIFITLSFVGWTFFGAISIDVQGRGITLTRGGGLSLSSRVGGEVKEILVAPGESVKTGDVIATIYNLKLEVDLENALTKRRELEEDLKAATALSRAEKQELDKAIIKQLKASEFEMEERKNILPILEKNLAARQTLHDEGLIPAINVQEAETVLMEEKIKIEDLQGKIADLRKDFHESYKSDELKNYERLYNESVKEVNELQARSSYLKVESPIDGRVIEVRASHGEEVKEGQSLVWIERPPSGESPVIMYCYIPAVDGNKVLSGMKAQIELSMVDTQKYGYLVGTVKSVSEFPVSDLHVYSIVHNQELVEYLTSDNPAVIEVIIVPEKDDKSASGYKWTSGRGPEIELRSGIIGSIRITVEQRRPISYLFPQWWWLPEAVRTD
jgi:HlyD family secretion protein